MTNDSETSAIPQENPPAPLSVSPAVEPAGALATDSTALNQGSAVQNAATDLNKDNGYSLHHLKEEFHAWMCDAERETDDILAWLSSKL